MKCCYLFAHHIDGDNEIFGSGIPDAGQSIRIDCPNFPVMLTGSVTKYGGILSFTVSKHNKLGSISINEI
ncbi:hypothetical protein DERP_003409 [Dermatophagoides pteronyssinus]|uniref:Uncharacterized protein n=1 Tax=Dermatophagoides pteronyssinus TaxID=6956 RepID=A0ABQ8JJJ0_DERPT|nr:hypothetical protein DERP_003409 [Dermatophagoides pteronyssinus]